MSNRFASIGDNMSSSEVKGEEWTTIDEEPHMFPVELSGGYYPLNLGENLKINNEGPNMTGGKFEIVRKLGWGQFSSVWLAESQGCKDIHARYQAVKVLTLAATTSTLEGIFPEFENLTTVTSKNPEHPGNIFVSLCKDLGDNMDEQIRAYLHANPSETYEPWMNSDLSPEPIITVKSQPLPNFGLNPDFSNLRIKLGDFGVALNLTPENLFIGRDVQPYLLKAPEILLGHAWSTPIDIWTLGCMVFECLVTTNLFQIRLDPTEPAFTYVHIFRMMQLLGPFPQEFLAGCSMRSYYFDEKGELLRQPRDKVSSTIEDCLDNYKCLKTEELGPAAGFIRRCLTIDPSARPTAKELLDDEWLKDV